MTNDFNQISTTLTIHLKHIPPSFAASNLPRLWRDTMNGKHVRTSSRLKHKGTHQMLARLESPHSQST